ncbi:MAG: hypothetical protein NW208_04170 [Bryobacter sp.]|nr:hypothetical protein [Bryobacter sp.]
MTLFFRKDNTSQIAWVEIASGKVEVLRSLEWVYPKKMDLSPDGQWIAYDSFAPNSRTERAIYLLAADGSAGKQLTTSGNYLFPVWSSSGKSLYVWGGAGNEYGLWRFDLDAGNKTASKVWLRAGTGRELPLGMSRDNQLHWVERESVSEVFWMDLEKPEKAHRATRRFAGLNRAPAWSEDGKRLAYLSRRGPENFGQQAHTVVVLDIETGEEIEVEARMAHVEELQWGRNAAATSQLSALGSDGKGRGGWFVLDLVSGKTRVLDARHGEAYQKFAGVLKADGSLLRLDGFAGMSALALNDNENQVAVSGPEQGLVLWDLATGDKQKIATEDFAELAWGRDLWGAKGDTLQKLWPEAGEPRRVPNRAKGFAVSRDGKRLAFTVASKQENLWRMRVEP